MQRVYMNNRSLEKQRLFGLLENFLSSVGEDHGLDDLRNSLEIAKSSNSNETYFDLLNKISNNPFNIPGFLLERSSSGYGDDLQVVFLQSDRVFQPSFSAAVPYPSTESPDPTRNMHDEGINLTREEIEAIRKIIYSQKSDKDNLKPSTPIQSVTLTLDEDSYSLMMMNNPFSRSWALGLFSFFVQICLSILALKGQSDSSEGSSLWNIPFRVNSTVRIGQFFTVIMFIAYQKDLFSSIRCIQCLSYGRRWDKVVNIRPEERSVLKWIQRILFPNLLKLSQALLVTVISFILIAQSSGIINLLKDFAALVVLSDFDNSCFELASNKYLGQKLAFATRQIIDGVSLSDARLESENASYMSRLEDSIVKKKLQMPRFPQILLLLLVTGGMLFVSFVVVRKQDDATYFFQKYPNCPIGNRTYLIEKVGDGICDGGFLNTRKCGLDGGDCRDFKIVYPQCAFLNINQIGNGNCDDNLNIEACGFDELDCCPYKNDPLIGNNICNGGIFVSGVCGNDLNDCQSFITEFDKCDLKKAADRIKDLDKKLKRSDSSKNIIIGDGVCDTGAYISPECGFEMGDCRSCSVPDYELIGDGNCNGGGYNTPQCHWDFGDCINENYTDCHVDMPLFIGDGVCDGDIFRKEGCQNDGGDCEKCDVLDKNLLSNGICNDDKEGYNRKECTWDGRDCNRAKGMFAKQSSTADFGAVSSFYSSLGEPASKIFGATNAVDGSHGYSNVYCALTKEENDPYWSVYLSHVYKIEAIMIYSVQTKYHDLRNHLNGFKLEILLFNESKYVYQSYPNDTMSDKRTIVDFGEGIIGNEVKISIPGKNKTLAIDQVEVYGQMHLENLALRRNTDQVTNGDTYTSESVVDGNLTFTGLTSIFLIGDSWSVHLKDIGSIKQIRYYFSEQNARDAAENFTTTISDAKNEVFSYQDNSSLSDMVIILDIPDNVIGNIIKISCSNESVLKYLLMTEVEVFGHSIKKNIAFGKPTVQSSTYNTMVTGSEKGVDGIIFDFDQVSHTIQEKSPWWKVDLLDHYRIDKIIFYLRHMGYTHWLKMEGMRLRVFRDGNVTHTYMLDSVTELKFANEIDLSGELVIGNQIEIDLPEQTTQLILAEVEVFGEKVQ